MIVRAATSADAAAIHAVHVAAFPTDAEARLVDALIGDGDQLVSVVADDGVAIIGHCRCSRMTVVAERASIPATAFGAGRCATIAPATGRGHGHDPRLA